MREGERESERELGREERERERETETERAFLFSIEIIFRIFLLIFNTALSSNWMMSVFVFI